MTDFQTFFRKANDKTYRAFNKVFNEDTIDEELLKKTISRVTFDGDLSEDNPLTTKLAIYTAAHHNYLQTLSLPALNNYKVNWGLKNIKRLD